MNEQLLNGLNNKLSQIVELRQSFELGSVRINGWSATTVRMLRRAGLPELAEELARVQFSIRGRIRGSNELAWQNMYMRGLEQAEAILKEAIEFLEMYPQLAVPPPSNRATPSEPPSISINMVQVANQLTETTSVIELLKVPQFQSLPDEQRKELEDQINTLQTELAKPQPAWDTVKRILTWALNFGRDVFLQVLPYVLAKSDHFS